MATILSNPQEIAALPAPVRRYGIFDAASMPTSELSERVIASGLTFAAEHCGMTVVPYDPTCAAPHDEKAFTPGTPFVEANPYWLVQTYQCGTVGTTAADVTRRVRARYDAGVQHAVESAVWTGAGIAGVPALTTAAGVFTATPEGAGAGAAIAALEAAFYDRHGYVGTIHLPTEGYAAVKYAQLMDRAGGSGVFTTPKGSRWSIGDGYNPDTGPLGAAPAAGFVWAFMTPQVTIWSSQVNQPDPTQTLDRTNNQWMALAETVYAHAWLCDTIVAVQVPVAAPATAAAPAIP